MLLAVSLLGRGPLRAFSFETLQVLIVTFYPFGKKYAGKLKFRLKRFK